MTAGAEERKGAQEHEIEIGPLRPDEAVEAADVCFRAFRPTPLVDAVLEDASEKQIARMRKFFVSMLTRWPGQVYVARSKGQVLGVMRMVESPGCQMSARQKIAMIPMMLTMGKVASRVGTFRGEWAKRDPDEVHFHLDPLTVRPGSQGQGIGSQLLARFCEATDGRGIGAYLETDQDANVRLYGRFGFVVVDTTEVLGVTNTFMWREPRGGGKV